MEFTKLPTDSFYIFCCFSGLWLIYYFTNLYFKKNNQLNNSILTYSKEAETSAIKISNLEKQSDSTQCEIKLAVQLFEKKYKIEYGKIKEIGLEELNLTFDLQKEVIEEFLRIENLLLIFHTKINDAKGDRALSKIQMKELKRNLKYLKTLSFVTAIMLTVGISITFFGLYSWYNKFQLYQDKLTRLNYEVSLKKSKVDSTLSKNISGVKPNSSQ